MALAGLKELLKKKAQAGKYLKGDELDAKRSVVDEMEDIADSAMAGKMRGLKKVTVAAPDEESLEEGLEMAQETVGEMGDMMDGDMMEDEEGMSEELDLDSMSPEEIESMIQELEEAKQLKLMEE